MPNRNTNTLTITVDPLQEKPHVMTTIRGLIAGEQHLSKDEKELVLLHILHCYRCQEAFEKTVESVLNDPSLHSTNDLAVQLLLQLKQAHLKNQELDEEIAAYAEVIEKNGAKEAAKRFPAFSLHLEHCNICKAEVEEMRSALKQAERDGLIAPLRIGKK